MPLIGDLLPMLALLLLTGAVAGLLAGLLAYFGMTIVLLEGETRRRVFLALVFGVLAAMMFRGSGYDWFTPALPCLAWLVIPALLSVFEAGRRFQQRGA